MRFLLAAGAIAAGGLMVWLAGAVPVLHGEAPGSALDAGPQGVSRLAQGLRDQGILASSLRIDGTPEGVGLSPASWDQWGLRPEDGVLSVRSDVQLRPAELVAARAWLEQGGRLVVVADTAAELAIAVQLAGVPIASAPLRDGAYVGSPDRPVLPDGAFRYQLDGALAVGGGQPVIASAGLGWVATESPRGPAALRSYSFASRFTVGEGHILVLGDSFPVTNGGRAALDNERLVRRVTEELAAGGGAVYIDEGHRSGGLPVRVDLAMQGIGPSGRLALGLLVAFVVATALFPWPRRLADAVRRWVARRRPAEAAGDPVAAVRAAHPGWDPSLLARLAARPADEPREGQGGREGPQPVRADGPAPAR